MASRKDWNKDWFELQFGFAESSVNFENLKSNFDFLDASHDKIDLPDSAINVKATSSDDNPNNPVLYEKVKYLKSLSNNRLFDCGTFTRPSLDHTNYYVLVWKA